MTPQQVQVLEKKTKEKHERILGEIINSVKENSAQAVYFNTVDVQQIDTSLQTSIDGKLLGSIHDKYPNILFIDAGWDLIKPSKWYIKLVTEGLNVDEDEVLGRFTGNFKNMHCEKRGNVYKPEVEAGKHNPYIKMLTARQSSSRRMKTLNYLEKASKKKIFLIQSVVTMPDSISMMLFNDPKGKEKFHKIITLFAKKFDKFLLKRAKVSNDFQSGIWLNEHSWSSLKPLNDHLHGHFYYPNVLVDKKTQKIVRFQPFFSEGQIEVIKDLWRESIRKVLGDLPDLNREINVHHDYKKEKAKKLHSLKYFTRSWLHDLGKYFAECNSSKDDERFDEYYEWMKERFKKFVDWGAVENRTYVFGFLHNTKKIFAKYGLDTEFEHDKSKFCPVCGGKHTSTETIRGFPNLSKITILMAYKSSYLKIGELKGGNG